MLVKVNATLVDSSSTESLQGLTAELLDKDPLSTDFLGKAIVGPQGRVEFVFDLTRANDLDSLGEVRPDLHVVVRDRAGAEAFRSHVIPNVAFLEVDPVTGARRTTVDLVFRRA